MCGTSRGLERAEGEGKLTLLHSLFLAACSGRDCSPSFTLLLRLDETPLPFIRETFAQDTVRQPLLRATVAVAVETTQRDFAVAVGGGSTLNTM